LQVKGGGCLLTQPADRSTGVEDHFESLAVDLYGEIDAVVKEHKLVLVPARESESEQPHLE